MLLGASQADAAAPPPGKAGARRHLLAAAGTAAAPQLPEPSARAQLWSKERFKIRITFNLPPSSQGKRVSVTAGTSVEGGGKLLICV